MWRSLLSAASYFTHPPTYSPRHLHVAHKMKAKKKTGERGREGKSPERDKKRLDHGIVISVDPRLPCCLAQGSFLGMDLALRYCIGNTPLCDGCNRWQEWARRRSFAWLV
jgi:hypothetical protein